MSKRIVFILLIAFQLICLLTNTYSQSDLERELLFLADTFDGTIGIMAKHLKTGEIIAVNAQCKFSSASVIKVPVMVEFFYQVSEGRVDPQLSVELTDSTKWGGSGILQFFDGAAQVKLIDAVMLMIVLSDNTATNLVIDALGSTHQDKLGAVNNRMVSLGLKNTRLLNKLMSWETKTDSSESIRYGVGVTTPEDMALLLEKMYRGELPHSEKMIAILKHQFYSDMIPRYLPFIGNEIDVAHKTGAVSQSRSDVGIIFAPQGDYVLSIFCDESEDHRDSPDNAAILAAARASRCIWNHFTGDQGFETQRRSTTIDWNTFPGGKWAKLTLQQAPFPHPDREQGFANSQGDPFAYKGHYDDGSAVVIIPDGWRETKNGSDFIVHFHGHNNHVLNALEQFKLPQQLIASRKNAILVLVQGPKDAPDSFGGKMEDPDGFKNFMQEIMASLKKDGVIATGKIGRIIISAHSGGYRPAAFVLDVGGLTKHISDVFLFDAFYGQHDKYLNYVKNYRGRLISVYTSHLAEEHREFFKQLDASKIKYCADLSKKKRLTFYPTEVCHDCVMEGNFEKYLKLSQMEEIEE